jgi:hypothetical protein
MSRHTIALLVALLAAGAAPAAANTSALARVRAVDPGASRLVQEAAARSPTFRELVAEIEASDVIVYVAESDALRGDVQGALRFMGSGAGERYLRVDVRRGDRASITSLKRAIATLAHELMHALEVAGAGHVVDRMSFEHFYRNHANRLRDDIFDTRAALEMGQRVHFEMTGRRY